MIIQRKDMPKNPKKGRHLKQSAPAMSANLSAALKKRMDNRVQKEGRRPRILLSHLETGQSNRWTKPVAASLAKFGFDVDIGPTHQTPLQVVRLAMDNDVHVVCVSIAEMINQPLLVQLSEALKKQSGAGIRLVGGGAGLNSNPEELYRVGVDLIVDLDPVDIRLACRILDLLDQNDSISGP